MNQFIWRSYANVEEASLNWAMILSQSFNKRELTRTPSTIFIFYRAYGPYHILLDRWSILYLIRPMAHITYFWTDGPYHTSSV
jgi:hypothetical protein